MSSNQDGGRIEQADAIDFLRSIPPGSTAMVITDPPYGIAYHSNHYVEKNPHAPIARDWNFQIDTFLREVARVLPDGGALYLFTRWDVFPLWAREIPPPLKLSNAIIWKKDNWSTGDLIGNFGNQYEMLMFATKGRHRLRGKRWPNVWEFPRIPAKRLRMPGEKPVGLYQRAIESSTNHGDLIVDPYCGSGTAAEASAMCGRQFALCDIDPAMVAMSRRRLGMPVTSALERSTPPPMPRCPVFQIEPPSPAMWGLHPEDLTRIAEFLAEQTKSQTVPLSAQCLSPENTPDTETTRAPHRNPDRDDPGKNRRERRQE